MSSFLRRRSRPRSSRSLASIVRANVLTPFNLILGAFGGLTLTFGDPRDALFLGVLLVNSSIGIGQELRARRALDRLSSLVAAQARVRRHGSVVAVAAEELVVGDLVDLAAGDQVVADGTLETASGLFLDESILTGETEAVSREQRSSVRSGSFVVEGTGRYRVTAVGSDSFAGRVTGQARSFRHPRSPLERAVNRLLYVTAAFVVLLGALLGYSLYHRHLPIHAAIATATAGVVTLIPEGLVVLISVTYAVAAARMSRHGVLTQQLNAIESLASVDTICLDKTGTLTEASLRVIRLEPTAGVAEDELSRVLATLAAASLTPNATLQAIARAYGPGRGERTIAAVPFSSSRRWSAIQMDSETLYLGAPGRVPSGALESIAEQHQSQGRRVLAIARGDQPLAGVPAEVPPADIAPLGLVVLSEQLRPNVAETIRYLQDQNVEIKVLSGDDPRTVAAVARDAGITVAGVSDETELPGEPEARQRFAANVTVVGRVSPEGKQAIVQALRDQGRYVAMIGDGVNDVPALKTAQLAIAQGNGTQMARTVADLVLITGDFASIPRLIAEGRRALRNLQRVTNLYLTRSVIAACLVITIGIGSDAYPLLPRHISIAGTLTLGVPTLVLALAPSSGAWRADQFTRAVGRFAVTAGTIIGAGLVAAYLFARHDLDLTIPAARTVTLTSLVLIGLYLVNALEAGSSHRRSTLVAAMCAALAGLYAAILLVPAARDFFELTAPGAKLMATSLGAGLITIFALTAAGFSTRTTPTTEPLTHQQLSP